MSDVGFYKPKFDRTLNKFHYTLPNTYYIVSNTIILNLTFKSQNKLFRHIKSSIVLNDSIHSLWVFSIFTPHRQPNRYISTSVDTLLSSTDIHRI